MANFLAFTRTANSDYGTLAAPKGMRLLLNDVLVIGDRLSGGELRDIWLMISDGDEKIVGLYTTNEALLGADAPFGLDAGGRIIKGFYGVRLGPTDLVPEHAALDQEFRSLLRVEAGKILEALWDVPSNRRDTSLSPLTLPYSAQPTQRPLDVERIADMRWPAAEAAALWQSARASNFGDAGGAAVVALNASPTSRELPIETAFLAIATGAVSKREETLRASAGPVGHEEPPEFETEAGDPAKRPTFTGPLMAMAALVVAAIAAAIWAMSPKD